MDCRFRSARAIFLHLQNGGNGNGSALCTKLGTGVCGAQEQQNLRYFPVCVFFILIPFSLLSVIYSIIVWTLVRERNALKHAVRGGVNRNVLKMALTIVTVFAICWAPFNIYMFVLIFVWNWKVPFCNASNFQFTAVSLAYANTAINPLVYFVFVEHYRGILRKTLSVSKLYTSVRGAGNRLTAGRETFELTTISLDRPHNTTSNTSGFQVTSKRSRCESQATIAEEELDH